MVNIKTHPETLKELRAQDPKESTKGFSSERQPTWNPDFYLPSHRNDIGPIKWKVLLRQKCIEWLTRKTFCKWFLSLSTKQ